MSVRLTPVMVTVNVTMEKEIMNVYVIQDLQEKTANQVISATHGIDDRLNRSIISALSMNRQPTFLVLLGRPPKHIKGFADHKHFEPTINYILGDILTMISITN